MTEGYDHEMFVKISLYLGATSLDCFVPTMYASSRNDRRKCQIPCKVLRARKNWRIC